MITIASIGWDEGQPIKLTAVFDSSEKMCKFDYPDFPYLYFPYPVKENIKRTVCVKHCPSWSSDESAPKFITCKSNDKVPGCVEFISTD